MKVYDILHESIAFHAATIETDKKGRKIISPHGWREEERDCSICEGSGKDKWGDEEHDCGMCRGTGKYKDHVSDSPEMSLSNSNARAVIEQIIGKHFDYGGMVENKELPELRRKLIKMLNVEGERSSMHKDTTDNEKDRKMQVTGSNQNVAHIGHGQPRMVDMGRTDEQVRRYAHVLLEIVKYAQEHGLVVSWA